MAPNLLKWPTALRGRPKRLNQAFSPRPKTFLQKGLRSAGGLKLLKWGLPGRGVKSAKVRPTPYADYFTDGNRNYPRVFENKRTANQNRGTTGTAWIR